MNVRSLSCCTLAALLSLSTPVTAEPAPGTDLSTLERQLQKLQRQFEESERRNQATIAELKKQLEGLSAPPPAAAPPTHAVSVAASPDNPEPVTAAPQIGRAGGAYMNLSFGSLMVAGYSSEPKPAERLELGDHDPQKRGFSLRNAELAADGAVDPYLKGFANIVLKLDENDETEIELEESYLQTTALPADLQLKAGQFFANFGRQNAQHPHQWAFVDAPVILTRVFGPDGLRNIGTQLSWLAPTPFYTEASLGVFDSQGGTAFSFRNPGEGDADGVQRFHGRRTDVRDLRGPGDLLFVPRVSSSFDLSETQTLVAGISAAFGPNGTGAGSRTQIYGTDLYWKWKPEDSHAGFPFVAFQSEALFARYDAGEDLSSAVPLPAETLHDYGLYSQLLWGFSEGWVAGLRGEYADGNTGTFDPDDVLRGERLRLSPALTYLPSEYSKVRLQYNFDRGDELSDASSVWLQVEFDLGAHGAHKF